MAEVTQLTLAVDSRQVRTATGDLGKFASAGKATERSVDSLSRAYRGLGRAFGLVASSVLAKEIIQAADAYKNLNARLALATRNTTEFARAQTAVFEIAQKTRVGLEETAGLYTSLSLSTQSLGISQDDLLEVTEAINKALIVSGASAQSAQAALVQLGQGFASGTLRGEELNSVLEQAPRLAKAIADGLGVPIGKLRELGKAGELTGQRVFDALQKSAGALDKEFKRMPVTVSQATQQAANSISVLIGKIDEATGATSRLAKAIQGISIVADSLTKLPETIELGSLAKDLNQARTELKRLEDLQVSPWAALVPDLDKQLAVARERFEKLRRDFRRADGRVGVSSPGDETRAEARRLGLLPPTLVPDEEEDKKKPKKPPINEAEQYLDSLRKQLEATVELSAEDALLRDIQLGRLGKITPEQEKQALAIARQLDEFKRITEAEKEQAEATKRAADERNKLLEEGRRLYEETRTPAEALAAETTHLNKLLEEGAIDWDTYSRAVFAAQDRFDELIKKSKETDDELDQFAKNAAENIQRALGDELFNVLDGNFESIGDSFAKVIKRMIAEAAAADILGALGFGSKTSGGSNLGNLFSTFTGFFGGPKALGGPVSAGTTYLVGEQGPELFTPSSNGVITPNDQLSSASGGLNVYVTQNFTVGDVATISQVRQAVAGSEARIASSLARSMKYGGAPV